ncbi:hypothetical protein EXIGLDRAFT_716732 [Exidia glandulosa HHB12029]|uniref:YABBY protein C-terminal domain-containing protein n=1 Tax=Exidia glandulosa HHB12029 TaxID=1314781 RepID=A0A165IQW8_EXIGL|nr:hypothetical protein EXIGLDRAFT_716732 [Exidia glandulosa HHB12029]
MVATKAKTTKPETTAAPKKKKSSGGGIKKISPYNKFIRNELQRLKDSQPETTHSERFKLAAANWKTARENPKNAK